eukprot:3246568-Rhodomonas_salina.1
MLAPDTAQVPAALTSTLTENQLRRKARIEQSGWARAWSNWLHMRKATEAVELSRPSMRMTSSMSACVATNSRSNNHRPPDACSRQTRCQEPTTLSEAAHPCQKNHTNQTTQSKDTAPKDESSPWSRAVARACAPPSAARTSL